MGWTDGRNVRIDYRWGAGNADNVRKYGAELAALAPDLILAGTGTATVAPLLQATRTVPIVFAVVIDPVGAGFIASLSRPGGNATGFTGYEYGLSGKWLELLKEIAPSVARAAVLRDATIPQGVRDLLPTFLRQRWRSSLLRARYDRSAPSRGRVRQSHPQGRKARRLLLGHRRKMLRAIAGYNFLNNNDVPETERRIKLAFVCLMTAVSVPMIFAGEEFVDQHDVPVVHPQKQVDPVNFDRLQDPWRRRVFDHIARLVRFRTSSGGRSACLLTCYYHARPRVCE